MWVCGCVGVWVCACLSVCLVRAFVRVLHPRIAVTVKVTMQAFGAMVLPPSTPDLTDHHVVSAGGDQRIALTFQEPQAVLGSHPVICGCFSLTPQPGA